MELSATRGCCAAYLIGRFYIVNYATRMRTPDELENIRSEEGAGVG
jgi:hypothetical protein